MNAARTDSSSGSRQRRCVRGTPRSDEDEDQVVDETGRSRWQAGGERERGKVRLAVGAISCTGWTSPALENRSGSSSASGSLEEVLMLGVT